MSEWVPPFAVGTVMVLKDEVFSKHYNKERVVKVSFRNGRYLYTDITNGRVLCKVSPDTARPFTIFWPDEVEVELHTRLRLWPHQLYGPIFFHPEFPHLTSGLQESAHYSARSRGVLLEIR